MKEIEAILRAAGSPFRTDASFRELTTFRIGGPIAFLAEPQNEAQLQGLLAASCEAGIEPFFLGNGSNLLAGDAPYGGLVVKLGGSLRSFRFEGEGVLCGAGALLPHLSLAACQKGFKGLERLSGVPATVGGAVFMNAGCEGQEIGSLVEAVQGFDPSGRPKRWTRPEMEWGYRASSFGSLPKGTVLTRVVLRLSPGSGDLLLEKRLEILRLRRGKFPLSLFSAGSFFRGTELGPAGALLERAGMKGAREGDAEISSLHANFIVNRKRATSGQVLRLADRAAKRVKERFGVDLSPEVRILESP